MTVNVPGRNAFTAAVAQEGGAARVAAGFRLETHFANLGEQDIRIIVTLEVVRIVYGTRLDCHRILRISVGKCSFRFMPFDSFVQLCEISI